MLHRLRYVISVLGAILGPASGFPVVELFGTPGSELHVACASLVPPKALAEALAPKALVYIIKARENGCWFPSVRPCAPVAILLIPPLMLCGGIKFVVLCTPYLKQVHLWHEVSVVLHPFRSNGPTWTLYAKVFLKEFMSSREKFNLFSV